MLLTDLVDRFPSNPDYRFALSAAYAMGRPDRRRLDEAELTANLSRLQKAEDLLDQLRRDYPSVPQYLEAQMQVFRHTGTLHDGNGDFEQALVTYRRAVKLAQSSSPDALTSDTVMSVSEVYFRLAELLQLESERNPDRKEVFLEEAKTHLNANARLIEQTSDPTKDIGRIARLARTYKHLAEISRELGDEASAKSAIEKMKQMTSHAASIQEPRVE